MVFSERLVVTALNLVVGMVLGALVGIIGFGMPCGVFVFATVVWSVALFGLFALLFGPDFGEDLAISAIVTACFVVICSAIVVFNFSFRPKLPRGEVFAAIVVWVIGAALILFHEYRAPCI
jgi:hypothetical protein